MLLKNLRYFIVILVIFRNAGKGCGKDTIDTTTTTLTTNSTEATTAANKNSNNEQTTLTTTSTEATTSANKNSNNKQTTLTTTSTEATTAANKNSNNKQTTLTITSAEATTSANKNNNNNNNNNIITTLTTTSTKTITTASYNSNSTITTPTTISTDITTTTISTTTSTTSANSSNSTNVGNATSVNATSVRENLIATSTVTSQNCDGNVRTCNIIANIRDHKDFLTTCNVTHRSKIHNTLIPMFTFSKKGYGTESLVTKIAFDNGVYLEYQFQFDLYDELHIHCQTNITNQTYQKSLVLSFNASRIIVEEARKVGNVLTIYFETVEFVEEIVFAQYEYVDTNGNAISATQHLKVGLDGFIRDKTVQLTGYFTSNRIIVFSMQVQNNYTTANVEKYVAFPSIGAASEKKIYTHVQGSSLVFDSIYNITFTATVSLIKYGKYSFYWQYGSSSVVGRTEKNVFSYNLHVKTGCHNMSVVVSNPRYIKLQSDAIPFCSDYGINVTVELKNAVSLGETSSFIVTVHQIGKAACLMLDTDDNRIISLNVSAMSTRNPANCAIPLFDAANETIDMLLQPDGSYLVNITHFYKTAGNYKVRFGAYNLLHRQSDLLTHNVIDMPCTVPEITLEGLGSQEYLAVVYTRSELIKLYSKLENFKCNGTSKTRSWWKIFEGQLYNSVRRVNIKTSGQQFKIPPRVLDIGIYKICVETLLVVEPRFKSLKCGYINIIASKLVPQMKGGERVVIGTMKNYTIRFSKSFDPDTKSVSGIEFFLYCRALTDPDVTLEYTALQEVPFSYPDPDIFVANPFFESEGGCYGTGPGKLFIERGKLDHVLLTSYMPLMTEVELSLYMFGEIDSITPRISVFKQRMTVLKGDPPVIDLIEFRNAGDFVNPEEPQQFSATCEDGCKGNITFEWLLRECVNILDETCTPVRKHDLHKIVSSKLDTMFYSAKRNSYKLNTWYQVYFRMYRSPEVYAEVSKRFFVNEAPKNGSCSVNPYSGKVLQQSFTISCSGWTDMVYHLPLTYHVYFDMNGVQQTICKSYDQKCTYFLPMGPRDEDFVHKIMIEISDRVGGKIVMEKEVQVMPPDDVDATIAEQLTVFQNKNSEGDSVLDEFIGSENYVAVYTSVFMLGSLINMQGRKEEQTAEILLGKIISVQANLTSMNYSDPFLNETIAASMNQTMNKYIVEKEWLISRAKMRIAYREKIYFILKKMPFDEAEDVIRFCGTTAEIMAIPHEVSDITQSDALSKVDSMIEIANNTLDVIDKHKALSGILNMVVVVSDVSARLVDKSKKYTPILVEALKPAGNSTSEEQKATEQIYKTQRQIKTAQEMIAQITLPGAESTTLKVGSLEIASSNVLSTDAIASVGDGSGAGVSFDNSLFGGNVSSNDSYDRGNSYMSVRLKKINNPYTFGNGTTPNAQMPLTGITFNTQNGDEIAVKDTVDPISIKIERPPSSRVPRENGTLSVESTGDQWAFRRLEINNKSLLSVIIPDTYCIPLNVYIKENKRPTELKYFMKWTLPDNSSCRWNDDDEDWFKSNNLSPDTEFDFCDDGISSLFTCSMNEYSIFISDEFQLNGTYYLGIQYKPPPKPIVAENNNTSTKRRRRRNTDNTDSKIDVDIVDPEVCVVIKPAPPTPAPTLPPGRFVIQPPVVSNESLKYSMSISYSTCSFWDEYELTWKSDGCYVGPGTTETATECLCNHLTDFGGDVLVAPNPIDMSAVFEGLKNLGDNLGVLLVIISIFLVYTLLCVWARRKDEQDEIEQRIPTIDCAGGNDAKQSFLMTIVTGSGFGSGTTANIFCIFHGTKGQSMTVPLSIKENNLFNARSTAAIKVLLPIDVGTLTSIRVYHDNAGKSPSWYLRSIFIVETFSKNQYSFVCDEWLAVESKDGQIDRTLYIADEKDLKKFHLVFATTMSKGLLDSHIWFSVFLRPKRSSFTRVRRLSACLALIFLAMLTNAMFFGVGETTAAKTIIYLGNVRINFTGIMIGLQSSLIIIPPSIIIVEIFRRLKPKDHSPGKKNKKSSFLIDVESPSHQGETLNDSPTKKEASPKKSSPFLLPNWCQYIAYFLVVASAGSSAVVTFFYSMIWGKRKSNEWLASMFTSFFQSILVIQPVKAVVVAMMLSIFLRKPVEQTEASEEKSKQTEEKLIETRQKKAKGGKKKQMKKAEKDIKKILEDGVVTAEEMPFAKPSDSQLERARIMKMRDVLTSYTIMDIVTYLLFLFVVLRLSYAEKDANQFPFREDLMNMFQKGKYTEGPNLEEVPNPGYFYSWLRDSMIPSIFSGPWYNNENPKYDGFIDNHESLVVSIPRIRQVRVRKNTCTVPDLMKDVINHCEDEYSMDNEDTSDYLPGWLDPNAPTSKNTTGSKRRRRSAAFWTVENGRSLVRVRRNTEVSQYQRMEVGGRKKYLRRQNLARTTSTGEPIYYVDPNALLPDGTIISCHDRWQHFTGSELRGFPFPGRLATYSGGGYAANVGYNEETGWTVIADLHQRNWIDKQTRSVFIEFTVYNGNINLFATAFLVIELLPTGGAFPWADFKVFNGYRYALDQNLTLRLFELAFILFVIYFTGREIKRMVRLRGKYLNSFFNWIELLLIPMYILIFAFLIARWLTTAENIKTFKENPKDFVSFQYSAAADTALQGFIGLTVFLLNIKLLKLLQFGKTFYILGLILKAFFKPVMYFMIPFMLYFMLFAWCAYLAFGAQSEHYQSIGRTCTTQFLFLIGVSDFEHMQDISPIFGPLYFVSASLLMVNVVFNLFLAIICEAIDDDYEKIYEKVSGDVIVVDYMMRKFKDIIGIQYNYEEWKEEENDNEKFKASNKKMDDFEKRVLAMYGKILDLQHPDDEVDEEMELLIDYHLQYNAVLEILKEIAEADIDSGGAGGKMNVEQTPVESFKIGDGR